MPIDKKELSKLSPAERIKKLKSMEEEHKREFNEIERLIKESMQELKTDKIAEDFAPEQRPVDISRLFETRGREDLEGTAKREASSTASTKGAKGYQAIVQLKYDYTKLKGFEYNLSIGGSLTEEEKNAVGKIGERINRAERYMTESEKYASILDASRATLHKLKKETGLG